MTVLTQALSEKKLQSKSPNDAKQPLVNDCDHFPSAPPVDIESCSTASLASGHSRARAQKINSLTTLCVTLTALLVLTTGIVGGIYLYRQFAQYRLRHFRGWCSIPYTDPSERYEQLSQNPNNEVESASFDLENIFSSIQREREESSNYHHFDQEFDLDMEFNQYEKIEVPDFSNGRKGRFIHDFAKNLTGIVDIGANRCFILPLNRSRVLPPQSLFDLVTKMRNGYYDIDTEMVREVYRVDDNRITNFENLGYYIGRECANLDTYRLERMTSPVYKREVDESNKLVFHEFAGVNINAIEIINLPTVQSHN